MSHSHTRVCAHRHTHTRTQANDQHKLTRKQETNACTLSCAHSRTHPSPVLEVERLCGGCGGAHDDADGEKHQGSREVAQLHGPWPGPPRRRSARRPGPRRVPLNLQDETRARNTRGLRMGSTSDESVNLTRTVPSATF